MSVMTMTVNKLMARLVEIQREHGGETPVLIDHPRSTDYADASCVRADYAYRRTGPNDRQEWRVKNRYSALDDSDQAVLIIR